MDSTVGIGKVELQKMGSQIAEQKEDQILEEKDWGIQ